MKTKLKEYLETRKSIFWYIKDINSLSDEAILEGIIKYGDWIDLKEIFKIFGKEEFKKIYDNLLNKKRTNLEKIEINFIDLFIKNA
ncbi:MAG: hypothetical protein PHZ26_02740 [Candidatus Gracilibacteria bacterium]|nr:hypothetical protein [Candidatus Gracilibacteria bacterium]MDD2908649.1 hypothetical protein [Candidatus Gracilibacteria bacterium]